MPFENKTGLNVNNQYGPRTATGVRGVDPSVGVEREYVIKIDSSVALLNQPIIPVGAVVTGVTKPTAVTAVTVGGTAVTAATEVAPVAITTAGAPVVTGGALGDIVLVKYLHTSGTIKLT